MKELKVRSFQHPQLDVSGAHDEAAIGANSAPTRPLAVALSILAPIDLSEDSERARDIAAKLFHGADTVTGTAADPSEQIAAFRALARRISTDDSEHKFEEALRCLLAQVPKIEPSQASSETASEEQRETKPTQ